MPNLVWLLCMMVELFFAAKHANSGDIANTILYCFSAYLCLQFISKDGADNG